MLSMRVTTKVTAGLYQGVCANGMARREKRLRPMFGATTLSSLLPPISAPEAQSYGAVMHSERR